MTEDTKDVLSSIGWVIAGLFGVITFIGLAIKWLVWFWHWLDIAKYF